MADEVRIGVGTYGLPLMRSTREDEFVQVAVLSRKAPRFEVGMDGDALQIAALALAGYTFNLVTNPRFAIDIYRWYGGGLPATRETSVPGQTIPTPAIAVMKLTSTIYGAAAASSEMVELPTFITPGMRLYAYSQSYYTSQNWSPKPGMYFFDDMGDFIAGGSNFISQEGDPSVTFDSQWADFVVPEGATAVRFEQYCLARTSGALYFTNCMLTNRGPGEYADGDSAGWTWDDTAHASTSRQVP